MVKAFFDVLILSLSLSQLSDPSGPKVFKVLTDFCFKFFIVYNLPAVPSAGQKRASDPQKLELQTAGSCPVNSGTLTQVLYKSNKCSNHGAVSLTPKMFKIFTPLKETY